LIQTGAKVRVGDHANDTDDIPEGQDPILIQVTDHNNDTDDIPEGLDPILIQTLTKVTTKDHENDTDDIPEGLDPLNIQMKVQQINITKPEVEKTLVQQKEAEAKKWDLIYAQEDDDKSYELVQLNVEKYSQVYGIPISEMLVEIQKRNPSKYKSSDLEDFEFDDVQLKKESPSKYKASDLEDYEFDDVQLRPIGELLQTMKMKNCPGSCSSKYGSSDLDDYETDDVQLIQSRYTVTPHEKDTDDIVESFTESTTDNYNPKHSKQWNKLVE